MYSVAYCMPGPCNQWERGRRSSKLFTAPGGEFIINFEQGQSVLCWPSYLPMKIDYVLPGAVYRYESWWDCKMSQRRVGSSPLTPEIWWHGLFSVWFLWCRSRILIMEFERTWFPKKYDSSQTRMEWSFKAISLTCGSLSGGVNIHRKLWKWQLSFPFHYTEKAQKNWNPKRC